MRKNKQVRGQEVIHSKARGRKRVLIDEMFREDLPEVKTLDLQCECEGEVSCLESWGNKSFRRGGRARDRPEGGIAWCSRNSKKANETAELEWARGLGREMNLGMGRGVEQENFMMFGEKAGFSFKCNGQTASHQPFNISWELMLHSESFGKLTVV